MYRELSPHGKNDMVKWVKIKLVFRLRFTSSYRFSVYRFDQHANSAITRTQFSNFVPQCNAGDASSGIALPPWTLHALQWDGSATRARKTSCLTS